MVGNLIAKVALLRHKEPDCVRPRPASGSRRRPDLPMWGRCGPVYITGLRPNPTRRAPAGWGRRPVGWIPAGAQGSSQCELFIRRVQRWGGRCRPSLQPEPVMTLPCTAAEVLSGHVTLEVRCIDRVLVTVRQPRLQYGQGIHGFFCGHRGNQFVSSTLMMPMTERFAADIRHYIDTRRLALVRFAKGQSGSVASAEGWQGRSEAGWVGGPGAVTRAARRRSACPARPTRGPAARTFAPCRWRSWAAARTRPCPGTCSGRAVPGRTR